MELIGLFYSENQDSNLSLPLLKLSNYEKLSHIYILLNCLCGIVLLVGPHCRTQLDEKDMLTIKENSWVIIKLLRINYKELPLSMVEKAWKARYPCLTGYQSPQSKLDCSQRWPGILYLQYLSNESLQWLYVCMYVFISFYRPYAVSRNVFAITTNKMQQKNDFDEMSFFFLG